MIQPTEKQWMDLVRSVMGLYYFSVNQKMFDGNDTFKNLFDEVLESIEAIEAKEVEAELAEDKLTIQQYYNAKWVRDYLMTGLEKPASYYNDEDDLDRIREPIIRVLERVGILPTDVKSHQQYHIGTSNYSKNIIQPWHLWLLFDMNPWDADLQKRLLRTKVTGSLTPAEARIEDYEKMKHVIDERIFQIKQGDPEFPNS